MNKESVDLGIYYHVREFSEILDVNQKTALNWVQLGKIDSVKIGGTYLIAGERIQDRLDQSLCRTDFSILFLFGPEI